MQWAWGHGWAHCYDCHAVYCMLNEAGERVTVPIDRIKPEYGAAYKLIPQEDRVPMNEMDDRDWELALKAAGISTPTPEAGR